MPSTEIKLEQWIQAQLQDSAKVTYNPPIQMTPLKGDAGFRQYFRVNTQPSLLAVSAPVTDQLNECAGYFTEVSTILRDKGVPTPQVIACNKEQNFLLIEDFGDECFLNLLNDDSVDMLYGEAIMTLLRLQQIPSSALRLPDYDRSSLREEMEFFSDWFVGKLLGYRLAPSERELLDKTFSFLENQALEQPQVLVHRDYHSRNLIYREGEAPGVIDFQDAVWGPITYDLVSLLRDCYISWSPEQVKRWMTTYANLAIELGVMPVTSEAQWQRWFDTMGLQRHIKVLGIFSRLFLRDGKPGYLKDMTLVWFYAMDVAKQYPETMAFAEWCQQNLLPVIKQQPWYQCVVSAEIDTAGVYA